MTLDRHQETQQAQNTGRFTQNNERDLNSLPASAVRVPMPPVKPPKGSDTPPKSKPEQGQKR